MNANKQTLTHFDDSGQAHMVDVGTKAETHRIAIATGRISMQANTLNLVLQGNAKKGDLIFFKTNGRGHINHVGLVVEVNGDEIKFVHSSVQRGVIVSSTKEAYYAKAFASVRRVIVE